MCGIWSKLGSRNDLFKIYRVREKKLYENSQRKKEVKEYKVKQKILRDGGELPPINNRGKERKETEEDIH